MLFDPCDELASCLEIEFYNFGGGGKLFEKGGAFRFVIVFNFIRTAIQEQVIYPLRAHNNLQVIGGKCSERMVFVLPQFTLADDKHLLIELREKDGGRHQSFTVENEDLVRARVINELKVE